jgi:hypothetical protein
MADSTVDLKFVAGEALVEAMRRFRYTRAPIIEKEYYEAHGDGCNQRIRNELYDRISRLLGSNKSLIIEFADRDAACYNPNTDYFYNRGFADCLLFLRTLEGVEDKNISLESVLRFGGSEQY